MKLGFELLREGQKINQHIDRFSKYSSPGYKRIPLNHFLVVDFCCNTSSNTITNVSDVNLENYVRVNVSSDFTTAMAFYRGGSVAITFK